MTLRVGLECQNNSAIETIQIAQGFAGHTKKQGNIFDYFQRILSVPQQIFLTKSLLKFNMNSIFHVAFLYGLFEPGSPSVD